MAQGLSLEVVVEVSSAGELKALASSSVTSRVVMVSGASCDEAVDLVGHMPAGCAKIAALDSYDDKKKLVSCQF